MKARKLIEGASFDPQTLKAIGQAFDEAWASISHRFGSNPLAIERARLLLANCMMAVAPKHGGDIEELKHAALLHMAMNHKDHTDPDAPNG